MMKSATEYEAQANRLLSAIHPEAELATQDALVMATAANAYATLSLAARIGEKKLK